jgi:hypothetical protein
VIGSTCAAFTDALSIEEPLEIRLVGDGDAKPAGRSRSPCECPETTETWLPVFFWH